MDASERLMMIKSLIAWVEINEAFLTPQAVELILELIEEMVS